MERQFEILNADGSVNQEMTNDIPEAATDLAGVADVILKKRSGLKEVPTPDEKEVKFVNPVTDEEFLLVSVKQETAAE